MKVKKVFIEFELEVDADYTPARPAPYCRNHSHPDYSDPGDDEIVEITDVKFRVGYNLVAVPAGIMGYICDTVIDDVTEKCREIHESEKADNYMLDSREDSIGMFKHMAKPLSRMR